MSVLGRVAIEVTLWVAVVVGVVWLLLWLDVRPGAHADDVPWPDGIESRALRSTLLVLPPATAALALWLLGRTWARLLASVAGALLVATAGGWSDVDQAEHLHPIALVTGVLLLGLGTYAAAWAPPPRRFRLHWWGNLLLAGVAAFAVLVGADGVVVGWDEGLLRHPAGQEPGFVFLVPGLLLTALGLGVLARLALGFPARETPAGGPHAA